jgi:hypothetical protein
MQDFGGGPSVPYKTVNSLPNSINGLTIQKNLHHGDGYQFHCCEIVAQSQVAHEVTSTQVIQDLSITF